ncbi:hypothetical protein L1987_59981 [Smallanthus sonchifolius]|uniref:Uncharacterized protein n=1 Tax=Smallanthus sonchifolius TaxID=185202 RepID=A0ACB9D7L3_9ASTR|nr:hypothetical protein L1987_59981 [Smallanthus sonchifolius]
MTIVAHLPCNSDSWPVTKYISESFYESHKPQDRAYHYEDHFSWRKQRSSNEDYGEEREKRSLDQERFMHAQTEGVDSFNPTQTTSDQGVKDASFEDRLESSLGKVSDLHLLSGKESNYNVKLRYDVSGQASR